MCKLLNPLKHNKTLIKLDLSKTVSHLDVLQLNFSLEELLLHGTPFKCDGSDVIGQTQLKKVWNTRLFYKGLTQWHQTLQEYFFAVLPLQASFKTCHIKQWWLVNENYHMTFFYNFKHILLLQYSQVNIWCTNYGILKSKRKF